MSEAQTLAKVTGELAGARGPDVRTKLTVPSEWLLTGGQLMITRPRLASCEQCRGGGCAICNYQGAFALASLGPEPTPLELPAQASAARLTVRLPHLGFKRETDEVAGHWLVEVHPGSSCSPGVVRSTHAVGGGQKWEWKLAVMVGALALFWAWLTLR